MIKVTYKPGKDMYITSNNKNQYHQYYFGGELLCKGYIKNNKYIGYHEAYREWMNKGLKYIL
jgi:hypothetical protein